MRNKKIFALVCMALCITFLNGCTKKQERTVLPNSSPLEFSFLSGAGGWSTFIELNNDGTFSGNYHDSEMGSFGDDFPNGSVYYSNFDGNFSNIQKINDYTYSMTLEKVTTKETIGSEYIEDGIKYIAAEPFGVEKGKEFIFYTPDTPIEGLSEEFLSWWPGRYFIDGEAKEKLECYGIYNKEMGYGFFTNFITDNY